MEEKEARAGPQTWNMARIGEQLAKLTIPQLISLAEEILREIEIRAMEQA